jgi:hypothetical protein
MQEQIRSLVSREAPRKTQSEGVGIEAMLRGFDLPGRLACRALSSSSSIS